MLTHWNELFNNLRCLVPDDAMMLWCHDSLVNWHNVKAVMLKSIFIQIHWFVLRMHFTWKTADQKILCAGHPLDQTAAFVKCKKEHQAFQVRLQECESWLWQPCKCLTSQHSAQNLQPEQELVASMSKMQTNVWLEIVLHSLNKFILLWWQSFDGNFSSFVCFLCN